MSDLLFLAYVLGSLALAAGTGLVILILLGSEEEEMGEVSKGRMSRNGNPPVGGPR